MRLPLASLLFLILLVSSCSAIRHWGLKPVMVEGIAMEPAFKNGDRIFVDKSVDKLVRGDVVVFHFPLDPSKSYIKRVVALPGETVAIRGGSVLINGTNLDEPYVAPENNRVKSNSMGIKVPDDSYYVLGDNRDNSSDSRIWGMVHRRFIYGRFVSKYYSAS